jgi:hypothetical protein
VHKAFNDRGGCRRDRFRTIVKWKDRPMGAGLEERT